MAKTLKDVAKRAHVSSATASLVLNGISEGRVSADAADRVQMAAKELNYHPNLVARSLRTQESKTIGVISNNVATTPFAGQMLAGAQDVAWENGLLLLLVNTNGDSTMESKATNDLKQRNVDGFIYAAMFHQEVELPEYLKGQDVVLLDCTERGKKTVHSVVPNEYQGARDGVQHLVNQGHKRIAHISTSEKTIAAAERLRAYKDVLQESKIKFDASLVVYPPSADAPDGYQGMKDLLKLKALPTAVFCYTDRMAMGAYDAAKEVGLSIPDDISILGFDDQPYLASALHPALTTIQLPHREMGEWATQRLLAKLDKENSESITIETVTLDCPLIIRDSVAPPRK